MTGKGESTPGKLLSPLVDDLAICGAPLGFLPPLDGALPPVAEAGACVGPLPPVVGRCSIVGSASTNHK